MLMLTLILLCIACILLSVVAASPVRWVALGFSVLALVTAVLPDVLR